MALYAGPLNFISWNRARAKVFHQPYERPLTYRPIDPVKNGAIGWLMTGDMQLNLKERLEKFIMYYQSVLKYVNVLGLPHHGAEGSFDPLLLKALPNVTHCFAAAGKNKYGHPSIRVINAVRDNDREFIHVCSESDSGLTFLHKRNDFF